MSVKKRKPTQTIDNLQDLDQLVLEQQAQTEHEALQADLEAAADMYKQEVKKKETKTEQKEDYPPKGYVRVFVRHASGELDGMTLPVKDWITMCNALSVPKQNKPNTTIVHPFGKED